MDFRVLHDLGYVHRTPMPSLVVVSSVCVLARVVGERWSECVPTSWDDTRTAAQVLRASRSILQRGCESTRACSTSLLLLGRDQWHCSAGAASVSVCAIMSIAVATILYVIRPGSKCLKCSATRVSMAFLIGNGAQQPKYERIKIRTNLDQTCTEFCCVQLLPFLKVANGLPQHCFIAPVRLTTASAAE
eukprot:SAG11_NODE_149_length_14661_cov_10.031658_2_plen_189_part_00